MTGQNKPNKDLSSQRGGEIPSQIKGKRKKDASGNRAQNKDASAHKDASAQNQDSLSSEASNKDSMSYSSHQKTYDWSSMESVRSLSTVSDALADKFREDYEKGEGEALLHLENKRSNIHWMHNYTLDGALAAHKAVVRNIKRDKNLSESKKTEKIEKSRFWYDHAVNYAKELLRVAEKECTDREREVHRVALKQRTWETKQKALELGMKFRSNPSRNTP